MQNKTNRLHGLDLARFLAFCGMAFVNFRIVAVSGSHDGVFVSFLEGKAAALFVVLAGVGLGLAANSARLDGRIILKRAAFLMAIGLLNMLIFPADIIHYYAVYFVLGYLFLGFSTGGLIGTVLLVSLISVGLLVGLDYSAGWNWETLEYTGFWTIPGFVRNLFYNGWHPVFPWISFLFVGFLIARLDLSKRQVQVQLMLFGWVLAFAILWLSSYLTAMASSDLATFFGVSPIPPTPFYLLLGIGGACGIIGSSLLLSNVAILSRVVKPVQLAGRMSLTLYFAHILIGMVIMEEMGWIGHLSEAQSIVFTWVFCAAALLFAHVWARIARRGPLEELMRRIAG